MFYTLYIVHGKTTRIISQGRRKDCKWTFFSVHCWTFWSTVHTRSSYCTSFNSFRSCLFPKINKKRKKLYLCWRTRLAPVIVSIFVFFFHSPSSAFCTKQKNIEGRKKWDCRIGLWVSYCHSLSIVIVIMPRYNNDGRSSKFLLDTRQDFQRKFHNHNNINVNNLNNYIL